MRHPEEQSQSVTVDHHHHHHHHHHHRRPHGPNDWIEGFFAVTILMYHVNYIQLIFVNALRSDWANTTPVIGDCHSLPPRPALEEPKPTPKPKPTHQNLGSLRVKRGSFVGLCCFMLELAGMSLRPNRPHLTRTQTQTHPSQAKVFVCLCVKRLHSWCESCLGWVLCGLKGGWNDCYCDPPRATPPDLNLNKNLNPSIRSQSVCFYRAGFFDRLHDPSPVRSRLPDLELSYL